MVGPYLNKIIQSELEPLEDSADIYAIAATNLSKKGYEVIYAEWLITGKLRIILLDPNAIEEKVMSVIR